MAQRIDRRTALEALLVALGSAALAGSSRAAESGPWKLATFTADVTPPLGHSLLGGSLAPATSVDDPLFIKGFVLLGGGDPIVLAAIDWCEIRNDAYDRWLSALAKAAGTSKERVFFSSVHQHDAPLADLTATRLLEEQKIERTFIDLKFFEACIERASAALVESVKAARPVTHLGIGQAKVVEIASSRRIIDSSGKITFGRYSQCRDPAIQALPEGLIDPWLKTISFWNQDEPLAAISSYATHPMSYYGRGQISSDFVGLARARRQKDLPAVAQIYCSGCSGDVTAGKYNDGSNAHRQRLVDHLYDAMVEAWKATKRQPLGDIAIRSAPLVLPHRDEAGFTKEDLERQLNDTKLPPFERAHAALGLSSRAAHPAGHTMPLSVLDFGPAAIVLFPGESFVAYQLMAQQTAPDKFVMSIGYGECSTGYLPTEQDFREGFAKEGHSTWTWVTPQAEKLIATALKKVLGTR